MKRRIINLCEMCGVTFDEAYDPGVNAKCPNCFHYTHSPGKSFIQVVLVQVWVSKSAWWKPWTWWSGDWRDVKALNKVAK